MLLLLIAVVVIGPSFAYSLPMHSVHTRRDRVASLPPCRLHDAAIQRASPLGPGRALTLPCGWNNAGQCGAFTAPEERTCGVELPVSISTRILG